MKITLTRVDNDVLLEVEREPMPPERFRAVCKLLGAAIGGGVLLGAVHMVGLWAIVWAVGAMVAVGLYKMMREI